MTMIHCDPSTAFSGLLKTDLISNSIPQDSKINLEIEMIKQKAAILALTLFDPDRKDLTFAPEMTFGSIFSQNKYGSGFTKGLSIILAYSICLEENPDISKAVLAFASKVHETTQNIFKRISSGDCKLSDVRKLAEQLDNYGGYYERTYLSEATSQQLAPEKILKCPLEIDPCSGHLIARISPALSQQLLEAYRPEIDTHITDEGKKNLSLPYNLGIVVVVYKDELASLPKEKIESLLSSNRQVEVAFTKPYIVPVRGDNRYALIASILMQSSDITNIRKEMELGELYSEGRPLRYTFGAIYNPHSDCSEEDLIKRMRQCTAIQPWMHFIDKVLKDD